MHSPENGVCFGVYRFISLQLRSETELVDVVIVVGLIFELLRSQVNGHQHWVSVDGSITTLSDGDVRDFPEQINQLGHIENGGSVFDLQWTNADTEFIWVDLAVEVDVELGAVTGLNCFDELLEGHVFVVA